MTTSAAQPSNASPTAEPLENLLSTIEEARALPQPEPYKPNGGDPLASLSVALRDEAERQQAEPPSAWDEARSDAAPRAGDQQAVDVPSSGTQRSASQPSPPRDSSREARLGREVLAALQARPLDGAVRAAAVERLAAQLDAPDPQALREILAILVTGQLD